ncbi:MAG: class I SAM-dependent methyltransferase [Betaproteobacteria bacterium]
MSHSAYLNFLKQYVRNGKEIGAIGPDSVACVNGLLKSVHFESAKLIVEFGAASGTVTREILQRKNPACSLICFEKNALFYDNLRKAFLGRNVFIVPDDVFDATHVLSSRFGIPKRSVDCIISTLPCSSMRFAELLNKAVLPLLNEEGVFIQYMHTVSVLKGFRLRPILGRLFRRVESEIVFRNIPPALIYTCRMARRESC